MAQLTGIINPQNIQNYEYHYLRPLLCGMARPGIEGRSKDQMIYPVKSSLPAFLPSDNEKYHPKQLEAMKRTKTPQQIHEQWQRISRYIKNRKSSPNFMTYLNTYARYCNRMANYNGKSPYWHNGKYYYTERNNAPVPVEIYAAK